MVHPSIKIITAPYSETMVCNKMLIKKQDTAIINNTQPYCSFSSLLFVVYLSGQPPTSRLLSRLHIQ